MRVTIKFLKSGLAVVLVLLLAGCTGAQVVTDINIVAESAAAVVTALSAAGVVSPDVAAKVVLYAKQASQLVIQVNTELANTADTKAQQWTIISGYFAAVVVPNIPGAPAGLATTIAILDAALVALEGALASQLGGTVPAKAAAKSAVLPAPAGTTMQSAVVTANQTLARIAARK